MEREERAELRANLYFGLGMAAGLLHKAMVEAEAAGDSGMAETYRRVAKRLTDNIEPMVEGAVGARERG